MAFDAVEILREKGFRAHRMEHGVVEWRAQRRACRSGRRDCEAAHESWVGQPRCRRSGSASAQNLRSSRCWSS